MGIDAIYEDGKEEGLSVMDIMYGGGYRVGRVFYLVPVDAKQWSVPQQKSWLLSNETFITSIPNNLEQET